MKERIKRWFTHNILLKLVALAMAVLTWLVFQHVMVVLAVYIVRYGQRNGLSQVMKIAGLPEGCNGGESSGNLRLYFQFI